jgi:alcohol dehydrogenase class IV
VSTSIAEVADNPIQRLIDCNLDRAVGWVTPSVRALVAANLPGLRLAACDEPLSQVDTLVVIGGGTLIDQAKCAAKDRTPALRLIAVPSIWGSGAEASPIVVLDGPSGKIIRKSEKYLPDRSIVWPQLADSVSPERARYACGDCWAHAIEGFLSPLVDAALRSEIAGLIRDMLPMPTGKHPAWFTLGARACAAQAQCSVGLVHGIAHTIEPELRRERPDEGWGHARLCACLMYPVFQWTRQASDRCERLFVELDVDPAQVLRRLRELFDPADYQEILPTLTSHWGRILRDACSRTHAALVRPRDVSYFATEVVR